MIYIYTIFVVLFIIAEIWARSKNAFRHPYNKYLYSKGIPIIYDIKLLDKSLLLYNSDEEYIFDLRMLSQILRELNKYKYKLEKPYKGNLSEQLEQAKANYSEFLQIEDRVRSDMGINPINKLDLTKPYFHKNKDLTIVHTDFTAGLTYEKKLNYDPISGMLLNKETNKWITLQEACKTMPTEYLIYRKSQLIDYFDKDLDNS